MHYISGGWFWGLHLFLWLFWFAMLSRFSVCSRRCRDTR